MNQTPETVAAALIDDEVLQAGQIAWMTTPIDPENSSGVVKSVFVAMMAVLIRRENA